MHTYTHTYLYLPLLGAVYSVPYSTLFGAHLCLWHRAIFFHKSLRAFIKSYWPQMRTIFFHKCSRAFMKNYCPLVMAVIVQSFLWVGNENINTMSSHWFQIWNYKAKCVKTFPVRNIGHDSNQNVLMDGNQLDVEIKEWNESSSESKDAEIMTVFTLSDPTNTWPDW